MNSFLPLQAEGKAIISVQDPIHLGEYSESQPDLALLIPRPDFYAREHPSPEDVVLVVEVMDSSASYDREVNVPLYARFGIRETWLRAHVAPAFVESRANSSVRSSRKGQAASLGGQSLKTRSSRARSPASRAPGRWRNGHIAPVILASSALGNLSRFFAAGPCRLIDQAPPADLASVAGSSHRQTPENI
jgi:hypothetical protein